MGECRLKISTLICVSGSDQVPAPGMYGTCSFTKKTNAGFTAYLGPTSYAGKKLLYSDAWANDYAVNYLVYMPKMKPLACKVG